VKINKRRPILSAAKYRSVPIVSGTIIICRYSKPFLAGTSSSLSGVAEIDEYAFFRSHIYWYVSEITSALIAHCDYTPFWISAGTNRDDLE